MKNSLVQSMSQQLPDRQKERRWILLASSALLSFLLMSMVVVTLTRAAPLQPDIDLADVDASFWGEAAYDESGWAIAWAGDVDADGYDDFLIGAYLNDEAITDTGQTYLVLGGATGWSMDMALSSNAAASFQGEGQEDRSGYAVSGAGDVNADGYDDFLIGAPQNDVGGSDSGQAYLILGRDTVSWTMDVGLSSADGSFWGENAIDRAGYAVAGVGDVNADGYDDIVISAPFNDDHGDEAGKAYLIFGASTGWSMDADLSTAADVAFLGPGNRAHAGYAVARAGDVDADGYDDFLIGAPGEINSNQTSYTYLMLGRATLDWTQTMTLTDYADVTFVSDGINQYCGWSLFGVGDVDGDGYHDVLVGCWGNDEGGTDAGQTYLVLGRSTLSWTAVMSLATYADASFIGEVAGDWSGRAVSAAGDVNADGYDDFLIGAYGNDESGFTNSGQAYLIFGRAAAEWGMDFDLADADASYWGETTTDWVGNTVSGGGDVNSDGFEDILVGARGADSGGRDKIGQTYLVLGNGLELEKSAAASFALPGELFTYRIDVTNTMPFTATGMTITDVLPISTTYVSCSGGVSCSQSGGIVSWSIGDVSSQTHESVTYAVRPSADVCEDIRITNTAYLSATNIPNWLMTTVAHQVIVTPTASFSNDGPICLGVAMAFTDTGRCAVTWSWNFGDGTGTSTQQNPSYTYADDGEYAVALTVTNASGHFDTFTDTVVVNALPEAAFTSNAPVCLGSGVDFTN
ncbi:MAG: FG-GAP repeat protein, partial [Anaerolineae bacterium]|nr:FG-GAP repeat protein [Anaerolineae bacterium]